MKEIEALYRLPVDEFTSERNNLAARVAADGDKERAREIKALKKPNLAAWAVNQLAERHAAGLKELVSLNEAMAAEPNPAALREASNSRRKLIARLVAAASKILAAEGHGASSNTMEDVSQTLQAGVTGDDAASLLSGTLTRPLTPAGFGAWGLPDPEDMPGDAPDAEAEAARREKVAAAKEKLSAAEEAAETAAAESEEAARAAEEASDAAARAARKAMKARAEADKAKAKLDALEGSN
jgi:hypothetical protein